MRWRLGAGAAGALADWDAALNLAAERKWGPAGLLGACRSLSGQGRAALNAALHTPLREARLLILAAMLSPELNRDSVDRSHLSRNSRLDLTPRFVDQSLNLALLPFPFISNLVSPLKKGPFFSLPRYVNPV